MLCVCVCGVCVSVPAVAIEGASPRRSEGIAPMIPFWKNIEQWPSSIEKRRNRLIQCTISRASIGCREKRKQLQYERYGVISISVLGSLRRGELRTNQDPGSCAPTETFVVQPRSQRRSPCFNSQWDRVYYYSVRTSLTSVPEDYCLSFIILLLFPPSLSST